MTLAGDQSFNSQLDGKKNFHFKLDFPPSTNRPWRGPETGQPRIWVGFVGGQTEP